MTTLATIMDGATVVAKRVEVELVEDAGAAWQGVFEAPRGWSEVEWVDGMVMRLGDGREGEFVVSRACGGELGGAVCLVQGVGPWRRAARCGCGV